MKMKDFLEVVGNNAFLSFVFCWSIIGFVFTVLAVILEVM